MLEVLFIVDSNSVDYSNQASNLLEALECPVCLETADEEPIYQVNYFI